MSNSSALEALLDERAGTARWAFSALPNGGATLSGARYLDVGCGAGVALLTAVEGGAREAVGIDVFAGQAHPFLNELHDHIRCSGARLDMRQANIANAADLATLGKFDIVSFIDTIEHVQEPATAIKNATSLLNPGGSLLIAGGGFYYSRKGHHLWNWCDVNQEPWWHLYEEFRAKTREEIIAERNILPHFFDEYENLNKVTMAVIEGAAVDAGLEQKYIWKAFGGLDQIAAVMHKVVLTDVPRLEDLFIEGVSVVYRAPEAIAA